MDLPDKVKKKLAELPDKPGCYMMRDRRGRIIYVGKAVSLRKRVQSYFRSATLRQADPKLRGLIRSVCDLDYIVVRNEAEAVLTEGQLIKDYRPRYNVSFKDDKRFLLLRADPHRAFPGFNLCRFKRDDGARYFGPYASSQAARATVDFIEKRFGLRKCTPPIPDAETYRHCINDIIRYCSAPCVNKITHEAYTERFDEACAFLEGKRLGILKELREVMEEEAAKLQFEKAAALRDTYLLLQRTIKQNARITTTPEMKRLDAEAALQELQDVLSLKHRPEVIEAYDISNISGTHAVASMVCFVNGLPRRNRYRRFRIQSVEGSDDPAMMAEVIRRRFTMDPKRRPPMPDLVIVDGGITQLLAARKELALLGLTDQLPSAGLAKRYEELHWQEKEPAIRLPRRSPALKVLQRLRDEAHRFAITYHRHLRGQRIRESLLDDIPGIGPTRKQHLLQHFGSVRRLIKASEEDIAAVPGIGYDMAKQIHDALDTHADDQQAP